MPTIPSTPNGPTTSGTPSSYDAENGAVGFGGTPAERRRLDNQVDAVTASDVRKNHSGKETSFLAIWMIVGIIVFGAALWCMNGYDRNHDHVLSTPAATQGLESAAPAVRTSSQR